MGYHADALGGLPQAGAGGGEMPLYLHTRLQVLLTSRWDMHPVLRMPDLFGIDMGISVWCVRRLGSPGSSLMSDKWPGSWTDNRDVFCENQTTFKL